MIELFKLMRNKRMFMLMIGFIVFIAVMGFSLSDRKELSWPENFREGFVRIRAAMVLQARWLLSGLL